MAFINRNVCKSFVVPTTTSLVSLPSQECSEVIVFSSVATKFQDHRNVGVDFVVPQNTEFVFRGLTNSDQLSAKTFSGTGTLYARTQFFSFLPEVR